MPDGLGRIIINNNNIYEGEFKDGKLNSIGKFTYATGDIYEGEHKDNKRNG
jgi:hypothetical protein